MRFSVYAQLLLRLASSLTLAGHDALHTLNLPLGNHTPNANVVAIAMREARIMT